MSLYFIPTGQSQCKEVSESHTDSFTEGHRPHRHRDYRPHRKRLHIQVNKVLNRFWRKNLHGGWAPAERTFVPYQTLLGFPFNKGIFSRGSCMAQGMAVSVCSSVYLFVSQATHLVLAEMFQWPMDGLPWNRKRTFMVTCGTVVRLIFVLFNEITLQLSHFVTNFGPNIYVSIKMKWTHFSEVPPPGQNYYYPMFAIMLNQYVDHGLH